MIKTTSAVLKTRPSTESSDMKNSRSASSKTRYFTTYPLVASYLWKEYVTDEVVVETEFEIKRFAESSGMTLSQ